MQTRVIPLHLADFTFPDARYEQLDGERELLPGVRVTATPGHTAGHQSAVVDSGVGLSVIAGQAVYSSGEWAGVPNAREGRSSAWDAEAYELSVERLKALNPVRVHFGHDREPWAAAPGDPGERDGRGERI